MKKFKFSRSGKYFLIAANMDLDTINVYDSSNIENLLSEKVSERKYLSALHAPEIKEMKKIVFSHDEEILFIATNRNILTFKVQDGKPI
jgi:hypothetical protein